MKEIKPDITIVLTHYNEFTFLNNQSVLDSLKSEFPLYVAKPANTSIDVDTIHDGWIMVKTSQTGH